MTNFSTNYNYTSELIAKDKQLKENLCSAAHVIPAKTASNLLERVPREDAYLGDNAPLQKKNSKTKNTLWVAGSLLLTAALTYLFRGKIKNILSKFSVNSSAVVENNFSERVLSNGKKVQKIIENTSDGVKKVRMFLYDGTGKLVQTKEKVITRSVNRANGKKYINIKKTYFSHSDKPIKIVVKGEPFEEKNLSLDINKYYNRKGRLLFTTHKTDDIWYKKYRAAYDANGKEMRRSVTYFNSSKIRDNRSGDRLTCFNKNGVPSK